MSHPPCGGGCIAQVYWCCNTVWRVIVIPAKAGIQLLSSCAVPKLDPRFRGNDEEGATLPALQRLQDQHRLLGAGLGHDLALAARDPVPVGGDLLDGAAAF